MINDWTNELKKVCERIQKEVSSPPRARTKRKKSSTQLYNSVTSWYETETTLERRESLPAHLVEMCAAALNSSTTMAVATESKIEHARRLLMKIQELERCLSETCDTLRPLNEDSCHEQAESLNLRYKMVGEKLRVAFTNPHMASYKLANEMLIFYETNSEN